MVTSPELGDSPPHGHVAGSLVRSEEVEEVVRGRQVRAGDYRLRFGLPPSSVSPVFAPHVAPRAPAGVPSHRASQRGSGTAGPSPVALVVYSPDLSGFRRLIARLGSNTMRFTGTPTRPVSGKAALFVGAGAIAGVILAQPFDPLTLFAPVYGLVAGGAAAGAGWLAVRGRGSVTILVDEWQPQLDTIREVLRNADLLGQPFVSPSALRSALHSALWHAARAVDEPGGAQVVEAFDDQLHALSSATASALSEIEAPSIEAGKAAVSMHLAEILAEIGLSAASASDLDPFHGQAP